MAARSVRRLQALVSSCSLDEPLHDAGDQHARASSRSYQQSASYFPSRSLAFGSNLGSTPFRNHTTLHVLVKGTRSATSMRRALALHSLLCAGAVQVQQGELREHDADAGFPFRWNPFGKRSTELSSKTETVETETVETSPSEKVLDTESD
ncbi:unnamed protein product, partial [Prorocentrum cordatum]